VAVHVIPVWSLLTGLAAAESNTRLAVEALVVADDAKTRDVPAVVSAGLHMDAAPTNSWLAWNADLALGAGIHGGFASELGLLGGVGVPLGGVTALSLTAGAAVGGVGSRIPYAPSVPLQLTLFGHWVEPVVVGLWARADWIPLPDSARKGGSRLPVADELHAGLDVHFGGTSNPEGAGHLLTPWAVGVRYTEKMGTWAAGVHVGVGFAEVRQAGVQAFEAFPPEGFCETFGDVVSQARWSFDDLRGERLAPGVWSPRLDVPELDEERIEHDGDGLVWRARGESDDPRGAVTAWAERIDACPDSPFQRTELGPGVVELRGTSWREGAFVRLVAEDGGVAVTVGKAPR
jgi:hypothetical protein